MAPTASDDLPVIDVAALRDGSSPHGVAAEIDAACRRWGFFYVSGHGVPLSLLQDLESASHAFFARPLEDKMRLRMELAGRAWRGFFPVGAELTSGLPDQKEGIYFGNELPGDDPRVLAGRPLHGANLFPDQPEELKALVLELLDRLTELGHTLMSGMALALGLERDHFARELTAEPTTLFRIFHYPALTEAQRSELWSVGEHTDYGLLTILHQDSSGGLEVGVDGSFRAAPPIEGTFVCNLGDMLDKLTGGRYRSTPHRVRNLSGRSRLSFPFFFDPGWDARVDALPGFPPIESLAPRWDGGDVHAGRGTYGEYLLSKVARVFPDLAAELDEAATRHDTEPS